MNEHKHTRRVRAGRPPENTGCLPVEFTKAQIEAWEAEAAESVERDLLGDFLAGAAKAIIAAAAVLVVIAATAAIYTGATP